MRLSFGFGWCLEGSAPLPNDEDENDEGSKEKLRGRKRKRLDVFKKGDKDTATESEDTTGERMEKEAKTEPEQKQAKADEKLAGDGVGEVGRLCIWCVEM